MGLSTSSSFVLSRQYDFFKSRATFLLLLLLFTVSQDASSANIGDEQYGNLAGQFWVWTQSGGVSIIDPSSAIIQKTIPTELSTPVTWGDAVFMRDSAELRKYAFVGDSGNNLMWVYDTETQTLITKVKTGSKPVHTYSIPALDEVWSHLDGDNSFDVFHMNQVRYRSTSAVAKDSAVVPGHGKLLVNPNLERSAFSTNVMAGIVTRIDTLLRRKVSTLTISNSSMTTYTKPCNGTHGIAFSDVDNSLYVECTNPKTCKSPYDSALCTGSLWKIDTESFLGDTENDLELGMNPLLPVRSRLYSPLLSDKLGILNFGIQGQSYATPEEQFILSTNKNLNVLSIIKPVAGGSPVILEVEVSYNPGSVVFWPKDSSITFGVDPNPGNYWAVVALESEDENSGLAFLDMDIVVKGFASGLPVLDKSTVEYVKLGPGNKYRPMKRGNDFIATPVYDITVEGYTKLAIVHARTRAVTTIPLSKTSKILWVPSFQASWSSTVASLSKAVSDQNDKFNTAYKEAIAVGGVALAFTLGGFCAIIALVLYKKASTLREFPALTQSAHAKVARSSDHGFKSLGGDNDI